MVDSAAILVTSSCPPAAELSLTPAEMSFLVAAADGAQKRAAREHGLQDEVQLSAGPGVVRDTETDRRPTDSCD